MNLEKYVVVMNSVVPKIKFGEVEDVDSLYDVICDNMKNAFTQYIESTEIPHEKFVLELFDQHSTFPQKNSDFVGVCNVNEEDVILRLVSTGDAIRLNPGDVMFIPNNIVFDYHINTNSVKDHNLVVYFSMLGEDE